jgi:RNA polymerase sigma-70 factor, ECF subfamily
MVGTYDHCTDQELIEHCCQGSMLAFETLVQRYHAQLTIFVQAWTHNHEDTGDVLQQVWLQLYQFLPRLQQAMHRRSLGPWLYQVAKRKCIDVYRRRRQETQCCSTLDGEQADHPSPAFLLPDPDPLPEAWGEQRETGQEVMQMLAQLPEKWRQVVWFRYRCDWTFEEIGSRLQMPPSTAKTYCHRARLRLRALLLSQQDAEAESERRDEGAGTQMPVGRSWESST